MKHGLWSLRARKVGWLLVRPRWWALLRAGVGPSIEHAELLANARFQTVIDVGANVGQFALWAEATLAPARIICIEPQPEAAAKIEDFAKRARCPVDVFVLALGDTASTATLYVTGASDSSSLLDPSEVGDHEGRHRRVVQTIDVPVVEGDQLLATATIERPALLKIDVQGAEDRVLSGLHTTLREHVDAVLVEVSFVPLYDSQASPATVVRQLDHCGFALAGVARVPGVDGTWRLDQADLLFVRS